MSTSDAEEDCECILDDVEDIDFLLIKSRASDMKKIEEEIGHLSDIQISIMKLTNEQKPQLDSIEDCISDAVIDFESGINCLKNAKESKESSMMKTYVFTGIFLTLLTVGGIGVYSLIEKDRPK